MPAEVLAMVTAANATAALTGAKRDAAVLVLFSGPRRRAGAADCPPTPTCWSRSARRRCATTPARRRSRAVRPIPGDDGPVGTALREASEETGIDTDRLQPLATLERMFIPPSGFHVVPVLAYSPDPGPVAVVDEAETAIVARVPVRAFINPENRLMVYRKANTTPVRRPGVPAQRDAGVGFHRAGDLGDARRRRLGAALGHRQTCVSWTTRWLSSA